jgi:hypothetical protein
VIATKVAIAQDVYYADVQDLKIWYNPALKTNKTSLLQANYRNVSYQGLVGYNSQEATLELPLSSHDKNEDNIGYSDLAIGIDAENGTNSTVKVSTAMMAFSYALPLNYDNTYLAAGLQGTYTFSQVSLLNYNLFPNHFDQYGALGSAVMADPYLSGYEYDYFSFGIGAAIFHAGSKRQWYLGGSVRHLNQPYTEWTHSFRLAINNGIQAGYNMALTNEDAIGGYGYFSWEGAIHEQFIGAQYTRKLDDSSRYEFSAGLAYRYGDALIPNVGLKFGSNRIAFYYEFNFVGNSEVYYNRTAYEFSYSLVL